MSKLRTAGELRGFLADVLADIRSGSVDTNKANAIAKIAAQINASLQVEVATALQLEKMGGGKAVAGSMVIATHETESEPMRQLARVDPAVDPEVEAIEAPVDAEVPRPSTLAKPIHVTERRATEVRYEGRRFREHCEKTVTWGESIACSSTFCSPQAVV